MAWYELSRLYSWDSIFSPDRSCRSRRCWWSESPIGRPLEPPPCRWSSDASTRCGSRGHLLPCHLHRSGDWEGDISFGPYGDRGMHRNLARNIGSLVRTTKFTATFVFIFTGPINWIWLWVFTSLENECDPPAPKHLREQKEC